MDVNNNAQDREPGRGSGCVLITSESGRKGDVNG